MRRKNLTKYCSVIDTSKHKRGQILDFSYNFIVLNALPLPIKNLTIFRNMPPWFLNVFSPSLTTNGGKLLINVREKGKSGRGSFLVRSGWHKFCFGTENSC